MKENEKTRKKLKAKDGLILKSYDDDDYNSKGGKKYKRVKKEKKEKKRSKDETGKKARVLDIDLQLRHLCTRGHCSKLHCRISRATRLSDEALRLPR